MDEDILKKEGVDKLLKSESGRKYIGELQKRYHKEILQPKNPDGSPNIEFQKVYGKLHREQAAKKKANQEIAQEMRKRKEWEKENAKHSIDKKRLVL